MTNEELLESAAKAAGLTGFIRHWNGGPSFIIPGDNPVKWNPLTDDGDALRLAVKFDMSVEISEYETSTYAYAGKVPRVYAMEIWSGDKAAATRRAIVRAAAALDVSVNTSQPVETESAAPLKDKNDF